MLAPPHSDPDALPMSSGGSEGEPPDLEPPESLPGGLFVVTLPLLHLSGKQQKVLSIHIFKTKDPKSAEFTFVTCKKNDNASEDKDCDRFFSNMLSFLGCLTPHASLQNALHVHASVSLHMLFPLL